MVAVMKEIFFFFLKNLFLLGEEVEFVVAD